MTFNRKVDVVERRLLERGYRVERGRRLTRIYTDKGFGRFPRKRINEILEIADRCGAKVSASQPFLIHRREG